MADQSTRAGWMRNAFLTVPVLVLLSVVGSLVFAASPRQTAQAAGDPVARGQYLVTVASCNDCHTPWQIGPTGPEPDRTRLLSGHPAAVKLTPAAMTPGWAVAIAATNTAFSGPWGISYAANLTPHETGLGVWTEDLFIQALKRGKHMGSGRTILPPMPWQSYRELKDEDLRAIFAYLQSIPPIENAVPDPTPPAAAPTASH